MKTILLLTDFSANATNAAKYAFALAKALKVNLLLCNAYMAPAEVPAAYSVGWPAEEFTMLSTDSAAMLKSLKNSLLISNIGELNNGGFVPKIITLSIAANVCNAVSMIPAKIRIVLIVAGTHDKGFIGDILMGNTVNTLINNLSLPLLLIPPSAVFKLLKKAAFATDLSFVDSDADALRQLTSLLAPCNPEILICNIHSSEDHTARAESHIKGYLEAIANRLDYSRFNFKALVSEKTEQGLNALASQHQVDMLTMVHRQLSFVKRVFSGSHTKKYGREDWYSVVSISGNGC